MTVTDFAHERIMHARTLVIQAALLELGHAAKRPDNLTAENLCLRQAPHIK